LPEPLNGMSKQKGMSIDVEPLVHLLKYLPPRDVTLIVLKGHLLIEEQLVSLLKCSLKYSAALDERHAPRFTFAHRLALVKSMNRSQENQGLWTSIAKLNTLRNDLAHKIASPKLNERINEFLQSADSLSGLSSKNKNIELRLRHALIFLCGALQRIQKTNSAEIS